MNHEEAQKFLHDLSGSVAGMTIILETVTEALEEVIDPASMEYRSLLVVQDILKKVGGVLKEKKETVMKRQVVQ